MKDIKKEDFQECCQDLHDWIDRHREKVTSQGIIYALIRTGMCIALLRYKTKENMQDFVSEAMAMGLKDGEESINEIKERDNESV